MLRLVVIPLVSALIGYITNVVAVMMMFRPREPVNILGYTIQGLIPRRQADIARKIGEVVERELLSLDDLIDQIKTPEMQGRMVDVIAEKVRTRFEEIVPRIVPAGLTRIMSDAVEGILRREMPNLVDQVVEAGREKLQEEIVVRNIVEQKILAFELEQLERIVNEVAARELRHIEVLGGVLGFVIGLVEVLVVVILP